MTTLSQNIRYAQTADKFMVRFPDGMRGTIAKVAKENHRSMNTEIVIAIERYLTSASHELFSEAGAPSMSRADPHFRLRLPESIKARIEDAAARSHRSMTAEIVARLENSLQSSPDLTSLVVRLEAAVEALERRT